MSIISLAIAVQVFDAVSDFSWQDLTVIGAVALASLFIIRRFIIAPLRNRAGCGSCCFNKSVSTIPGAEITPLSAEEAKVVRDHIAERRTL